eukprot:14866600-Heterocapsa_arctica.AAC.1
MSFVPRPATTQGVAVASNPWIMPRGCGECAAPATPPRPVQDAHMEFMMEQINDLRREVLTLRAGASPPRADMVHSIFHPSQADIVMAEPAGVSQILQQPQPPTAPAVAQG